jgi:hypothetical protein
MSTYPVVSFPNFPSTNVPTEANNLSYTAAPVVLPAAANTVATVAQVVNGTFDNTQATANNTLTLPPAAALTVGLSGALVGTSFTFHVVGDSSSTLTVAPGTGGTLTGSGSVGANVSAKFRVRLTNVSSGTQTYQLLRLA